MIVVIVMMAVIGMIGVVVLREGVAIYVSSSRQSEAQGAARLGLDRMTREIRELNNRSITTASATKLSFTNPYNTILTGGVNRVTFRLSNGTLERSGDDEASWQPLVENVTNDDIFGYYKFESDEVREFTPALNDRSIQWILVKLEVSEEDRSATLRQQVCLVRDRR